MKNILITVAHFDDEVLGMGGLVHDLRLSQQEYHIHLVVVCEPMVDISSVLEIYREQNLYETINIYNYEDQGLTTADIALLADNIKEVVVDNNIDTIFTHLDKDSNADHRIVHEAVMVASRPRVSVEVSVYGCPIFGVPHDNTQSDLCVSIPTSLIGSVKVDGWIERYVSTGQLSSAYKNKSVYDFLKGMNTPYSPDLAYHIKPYRIVMNRL